MSLNWIAIELLAFLKHLIPRLRNENVVISFLHLGMRCLKSALWRYELKGQLCESSPSNISPQLP